MPSTYTPDPTSNPATITIPSDGDLENAASVNVAFEAIADRTAHSQQPATDNTVRYPLAARTVARWSQHPFISNIRVGVPDWYSVGADGTIGQVDIADADATCTIRLDLPDQAVVSNVAIQIKGTGGHGAFPIAGFNKPVLTFYKLDPASGIATPIGSATDPSSTAAAYQASHTINIISLSETIDKGNKIYFLQLQGESGTGAIAGLTAYGAWAQMVVSNMDPGA